MYIGSVDITAKCLQYAMSSWGGRPIYIYKFSLWIYLYTWEMLHNMQHKDKYWYVCIRYIHISSRHQEPIYRIWKMWNFQWPWCHDFPLPHPVGWSSEESSSTFRGWAIGHLHGQFGDLEMAKWNAWQTGHQWMLQMDGKVIPNGRFVAWGLPRYIITSHEDSISALAWTPFFWGAIWGFPLMKVPKIDGL